MIINVLHKLHLLNEYAFFIEHSYARPQIKKQMIYFKIYKEN